MSLERLGADLGRSLLSSDRWNPAGYGEDEEVVALHRSLLGVADVYDTDGASWPDWGWPEGHARHPPDEQMARYLRSRSADIASDAWLWGWKDPRSTLFLVDWARMAPSAEFLLLYRSPHAVAASIGRLEFPPDVERQALDMWLMYNERLLELAHAEPERSIILNTDRFIAAPVAVLLHVVHRLGGPQVRGDVELVISAVLDAGLSERSLLDGHGDVIPRAAQPVWHALEALDEAKIVADHD